LVLGTDGVHHQLEHLRASIDAADHAPVHEAPVELHRPRGLEEADRVGSVRAEHRLRDVKPEVVQRARREARAAARAACD